MRTPCYVSGFGSSLPAHVLTNQDIERVVDTDDAWIRERTGISSRHVLEDHELGSEHATFAARKSMEIAGLTPADITHVINCTCTPDHLCPSNACLVARNLDLGHIMAFDLNAACSGFVYGLDVAHALATATPDAHILLVGVEALSRRINWRDRGTCVLFGDGAGAVVVSSTPGPGLCATLEDTLCHSDGRQGPLLTVGGGTNRRYPPDSPIDDTFYIAMSGREVFKFAVRNMVQVCKALLERNGLSLADVDLFIPHQANMRIIEAVRDRLDVSMDKVFVNIATHGNTSAASIPLALADAVAEGRIKPGMRVLVVTFGGGFTWAAALMRFEHISRGK